MRPRSTLGIALLYALAIIAVLIMAAPYIYMMAQSLAPWDQVENVFIPSEITLRSYRWLWTGGEFGLPRPWLRGFLNSIIVTGGNSLTRVFLGAIVGYALSVLRFKGQRVINSFILFHMFYPAIVLLVPLFLVVQAAGMYDTYLGMMAPFILSVWAVFMYTGFFRTIPSELIEAARLDGASELTVIFRLMVPMSRSITTVIFLFLFMERWVELMWDLIVVATPEHRTLNVLLATMFGPYGSYPGPLYAASVLLTFPILILFLIFSKNFVEGVEFVIR
ncbi:MAG TPA: carbohydrate ABC transporter permease [Chloroflexi bacterium]|nr:carbohydrate ABC transporter permease [Chloroflexota bacterium]